MPMGYKNSPLIVQKVMNITLRDLLNKGVSIYLDDIVVFTKTREEHIKLLRKVFQQLSKNNLVINQKKIQFMQEKVSLLGFNINGKEKWQMN